MGDDGNATYHDSWRRSLHKYTIQLKDQRASVDCVFSTLELWLGARPLHLRHLLLAIGVAQTTHGEVSGIIISPGCSIE